MSDEQEYLGDGVYASFDGYHIWLETPKQMIHHKIALEYPVYIKLVEYAKRIHKDD